MAISDELVPVETDRKLAEYLFRQFRLAKTEDTRKDQISLYTLIPPKLAVGRQYYFLNAVAGDPDITAEGLYIYKSTGWVFIA